MPILYTFEECHTRLNLLFCTEKKKIRKLLLIDGLAKKKSFAVAIAQFDHKLKFEIFLKFIPQLFFLKYERYNDVATVSHDMWVTVKWYRQDHRIF